MEIINRKYKEVSHIPIEKIKEMQHRHAKDLIQPREGGQINPEYVKTYGTKNINVSSRDVEQMAKTSHRLAEVLDSQRKEKYGYKKYY